MPLDAAVRRVPAIATAAVTAGRPLDPRTRRLYFAPQGAGRLGWPLLAGLIRLVIAVGGGWLALRLTGSLAWLFAALGLGLVAYGMTICGAVAAGSWFRHSRVRRRTKMASSQGRAAAYPAPR